MSRLHEIEKSFWVTILFVIILFSFAIGITLVAPRFIDKSWLEPTSHYMVQMYEVADPNLYISNTATGEYDLQFVEHVKNGYTLLAFVESDRVTIEAPKELERYITRADDETVKLTSRLLLTRPTDSEERLELYDPQKEEAFIFSAVEGSLEFWTESFVLLEAPKEGWHNDPGLLYAKNPTEYLVREKYTPTGKGFIYDAKGKQISTLESLQKLGFVSRRDLIEEGEHIYAIDGCWYCHTDQTRTLIQDTVLNGSDSFPAPPSSANEYIYQNITFPGTKRNGPDISRTGVKRPNRDWHKSHFWSPKTESPGSIMPAFHHFFDEDPRGTPGSEIGVPNRRFEAIYQYLMTKGTRITPPTEAWWLGKDPIHTIDLIDRRR